MRFNMFFVNDTAPTEIDTYVPTLSLHDALPIYDRGVDRSLEGHDQARHLVHGYPAPPVELGIRHAADVEILVRPREAEGEPFLHLSPPAPPPGLPLEVGRQVVFQPCPGFGEQFDQVRPGLLDHLAQSRPDRLPPLVNPALRHLPRSPHTGPPPPPTP